MLWQRMTWISCRTPLHAFMNTAQSSRNQVFDRIFHYHDNTPWSTTLHWFDFMVLRMAFVRRLWSRSISELLRSRGTAQIGIWLLAKCWLQTSGLISWLLHGLTSATAVCLLASVPHVSLHWYMLQFSYITMWLSSFFAFYHWKKLSSRTRWWKQREFDTSHSHIRWRPIERGRTWYKRTAGSKVSY